MQFVIDENCQKLSQKTAVTTPPSFHTSKMIVKHWDLNDMLIEMGHSYKRASKYE
jgi:hypothetical protein